MDQHRPGIGDEVGTDLGQPLAGFGYVLDVPVERRDQVVDPVDRRQVDEVAQVGYRAIPCLRWLSSSTPSITASGYASGASAATV